MLFAAVDRLAVDLTPRLVDLSKETERKYLGIGNVLEDLCTRSAGLERSVLAMEALAESDIGEAAGLAAARAGLEPMFGWTLRMSESLEESVAALARCRQRIRGIVRRESDLERAFSQLSFVVTLFRVESVALDTEKGGMLMALVQEILLLRTRISELFAEQFASLRRADRLLDGLVVEMELRDAQVATQALAGMEKLRSAMAESERRARSDEELRQRTRELSAKIGLRIDEVVLASQTQDRVSQKIAHACESLAALQVGIAGKQRSLHRAGSSMRYVEQVSLVTSGQIQQATSELVSANETLTVAMADILDTAKSIGAVQEDSGYGSGSGEVLGWLYGTAREQVEACSLVSQRLAEGTAGIVGLATDITGRVGEIAAQLHMIGINTQVNAAKAGAGTGLDALSAKTSEIARENGAICREVAGELARLAEEVAVLVASDGARELDCARRREELERAADFERSRQSRFAEQRSRLLAEQSNVAGGLVDLEGGPCSAAFSGLGSLTGKLDEIGALIDVVGRCAGWYADCVGCGRNVDTRMMAMADSYTMQSERALHAERLENAVEQGLGSAPARVTTAKAAEVEWF